MEKESEVMSNIFGHVDSVSGILSVLISSAVGWFVHRSNQAQRNKDSEQKERVQRALSNTEVEKEAALRAQSIYEKTIDSMEETLEARDEKIAELEKDVKQLQITVRDQDRLIELHREEIETMRAVMRLRFPEE